MNILLISQHYPPDESVGSLRAAKVATMLQLRGHTVYVITAGQCPRGDAKTFFDGLATVTAIPPREKFRLRAVRYVRRASSLSDYLNLRKTPNPDFEPQGTRRLDSQPARLEGVLARAVKSLLSFPDDEQWFVCPAYRQARKVIKSQEIELIYTSAPPHSTTVLGWLLKVTSKVRWVSEYRDPWTDQRNRRTVPTWFQPLESAQIWLEGKCLNSADHVIAVTDGAAKLLASKVGLENASKVETVLNGIPETTSTYLQRESRPFRIVHTGTFYHDRDPRPFLRALANFAKRRGLSAYDIRVDLIGNCRSFNDISVEAVVQDLGLGHLVYFTDWIPHDDTMALLAGADLLLLLATQQPLQVPNKLYDYFGANTPILAVVDVGGESERMLEAIGGHFVIAVPQDSSVADEAVERTIERAFDRSADGALHRDEQLLKEWSVKRQMDYLARVIGV